MGVYNVCYNYYMKKNSEWLKNYWASLSPEERSRRNSLNVSKGWAKTPPEVRRERVMKMVEARKRKHESA